MNHTIHIDEAPKGVWITLDNDIRIRFQGDGQALMELEIPEQRSVFPGSMELGEDHFTANSNPSVKDISSADLPFDETHSPRSIPESSFWLG